MPEIKHTPGPWHTSEPPIITEARSDVLTQPKLCQIRLYAPSGLLSFILTELDDDPTDEITIAEARANARLIAAAPELLETLIAYRLHHKLMLNVTDDTDCPCKICQMAQAAIRKAKGE